MQNCQCSRHRNDRRDIQELCEYHILLHSVSSPNKYSIVDLIIRKTNDITHYCHRSHFPGGKIVCSPIGRKGKGKGGGRNWSRQHSIKHEVDFRAIFDFEKLSYPASNIRVATEDDIYSPGPNKTSPSFLPEQVKSY